MASPSEWSLDRLAVGIWVARVPDGVAVYANQTFQSILGTPPAPDAPIGEAPLVYGICDRAGRPYPVELLPFSRVVATGGAVEVDDLVIHRRDGRRVFVRAMAAPSLDPSGAITHVTVAFIDISREVHAESARVALERRLTFVVDHAPIALFSVDLAGTITLSEGAGLAGMGVHSHELVGKSVFELYPCHPTVGDAIRRGLAGESFWCTIEIGPVTYDTWLTPARDASGAVIAVNGLATDVSELRKLQAAAIQSDRMAAMGALAASVAHEINNPLAYVQAALEGIKRELDRPGDAGQLAELLATAQTGFERIASITNDLRTFSRPDDDHREPQLLAHVVGGVLRLARKSLDARATLELDLAPTPPVLANEARLAQVVMNLIMNALDAVQDLGAAAQVRLATRAERDQAILEVTDNGSGIDPAVRERIFEPFVTTKPVGQGTGLGLFVCRNLVEELGGQLSAHDRPGGGTIFRMAIPASLRSPVPRASARSPQEPQESPSGASARVLVIDDEPLIGRALVTALRAEGYHADALDDGALAMDRLLAGATYDLVLCDLMMRGTTGMDIAQTLAQRSPALLERMVFMTGGAFTPRAAQFLETLADNVLRKPFDVVTEVRRLLRR
jgi:signal transduction histidine kinase